LTQAPDAGTTFIDLLTKLDTAPCGGVSTDAETTFIDLSTKLDMAPSGGVSTDAGTTFFDWSTKLETACFTTFLFKEVDNSVLHMR
jgi:hypothetical protein